MKWAATDDHQKSNSDCLWGSQQESFLTLMAHVVECLKWLEVCWVCLVIIQHCHAPRRLPRLHVEKTWKDTNITNFRMRGFSCGREHVGFYLESPLIFISFSRSMVAIKGGRDVAGTDDYIYMYIYNYIMWNSIWFSDNDQNVLFNEHWMGIIVSCSC